MGVSLVYVGKNDNDKEMSKMCTAIGNKLRRANIDFQAANPDEMVLPSANKIENTEVWLCGHSRFIEANLSVRRINQRTLGGYKLEDIADFLAECVARKVTKVRLICCESAQQQRRVPQEVGSNDELLGAVLGHELIQQTHFKLLDKFETDVEANVSHLEALIVLMANRFAEKKKAGHPGFEMSGLWGAGDITDNDEPISAFLQDHGSLEALSKMDSPRVNERQREAFRQVFENAHCAKKNLPDFFGYRMPMNILIDWRLHQSALKRSEKASK